MGAERGGGHQENQAEGQVRVVNGEGLAGIRGYRHCGEGGYQGVQAWGSRQKGANWQGEKVQEGAGTAMEPRGRGIGARVCMHGKGWGQVA